MTRPTRKTDPGDRTGEHAQVQANTEWKALADQAAESLWALHQAVGAVHLDDRPPG